MVRKLRISPRFIIVSVTLTITFIIFNIKTGDLQNWWFRNDAAYPVEFDNSVPSPTAIVPNIVHFMKLGSSTFSLTDLVCIRAAWLNQKPESVLIHCDRCSDVQSGFFWSEIEKIPRLQLVPAKLPTHVFGRKLSSVYHAADVLRLQILSELGGIFLDLDVFVVKSLDYYRRFKISIGVPPKQYLGTQVIVAHPGARFLKLWLDSYHFYRADSWYYNAGELPTTSILMKNPELVHVVPWDFGVHMLVVQVFGVCSAHWRDFHAIHLLSRHRHYLVNDTSAPKEFTMANIKTYNKSFGEMARYALFGVTAIIQDDREIVPIQEVAKVNLDSLQRGCDDSYQRDQWRVAKPMPKID